MSVSSVGSTNPYAALQSLLSSSGSDPSQAPSDPLQALYQAFSGGSSSDPLLAAIGSDAESGGALPPVFSPDMMQALLTVQGDQGNQAAGSGLQSLFGQFDANGDGQISQSEFEKAIGPNADQAKVDALFSKIDANGDGSISDDEMQSAMQKAQGHHHHHHHGGGAAGAGKGGGDPLQALLSGASADGTTSQTASNADGSTTTTITYTDGTKVEMTTPAAAADAGSGNASSSAPQSSNLANLLKQLISLQAQFATQFAAPTTSLTV